MKLKNLLPFFIAISFCATKRANTLENFETELLVNNAPIYIDSNNTNEYQQESKEVVERKLNDYLQELNAQKDNLLNTEVAYANKLHRIAQIHQSKKEYHEAIIYYYKEFKFLKIKKGEKYLGLGHILCNIGNCCYAQGKYSEAVIKYYQALAIYQKEPSQKKECGDILHKIGNTYEKKREFIYATRAYKKALAIRKKLGRNQPAYKSTLNRIAHVYQTREYYDKAIIHYNELLKLILKKVDMTDLEYVNILDKIKSLYQIKSETPGYVLWSSCIKCLKSAFC